MAIDEKYKYLLLGLAVLCSALSAAEKIDVTASVDRQSVYVGDLIKYDITIDYDSALTLTPPMVGANLGQFDVKDYDVPDEIVMKDGRRRQRLEFVMRTFTTGEYVIPPLPIEYTLPDSTRKVITTEPIKIEIKSLLGDADSVDTLQLRPLKKQVSLARDRTGLILGIVSAVIALVGLIFYLVISRKRKKGEEVYVDPRPAWEIAFADLAMLRDKDLPGKGEVKKFYFELSDIFRRYLGKKFDFDAIDMTTDEIGEYFDKTTLGENLRSDTIKFLKDADLVKFAKYMPPQEQPRTDWERAYNLVEKTREIFIGPVSAPEVAAIAAGQAEEEEITDPDLKYVPRELHDLVRSRKEEEAS